MVAAGAYVGAQDAGGATPLHTAISADVCVALLAAGAGVGALDAEERTALHVAQGVDVIHWQALIDAGANVNAACDEGYTPLLCVCCNEGIEAGEAVARVEVLVRCPAVDLQAALPDGRDAVAIAAARSPPGSFASVVAVVEAARACRMRTPISV